MTDNFMISKVSVITGFGSGFNPESLEDRMILFDYKERRLVYESDESTENSTTESHVFRVEPPLEFCNQKDARDGRNTFKHDVYGLVGAVLPTITFDVAMVPDKVEI